MFCIGRLLGDRNLGLWLAGLSSIWPLAIAFAGIGRPYAMAQAALLATILFFIREYSESRRTPAKFFLVALFAQATQWLVWSVTIPLAACVLYFRFKRGMGIARLIRYSWWYAACSLLLFAEMLIQLRNPVIHEQAHVTSLVWHFLTKGSLFSQLGSAGSFGLTLAGIFMVLFMTIGVIVFAKSGAIEIHLRCGLMISLIASILAIIFLGSSLRFMMTFYVVPAIFVGIGCRSLFNKISLSLVSLSIILLAFGIASTADSGFTYRHIKPSDTHYKEVATYLVNNLEEDDEWIGYPYWRANCLYPYGPLPDPILSYSETEFNDPLQDLALALPCIPVVHFPPSFEDRTRSACVVMY
jgi:hypothetical protein